MPRQPTITERYGVEQPIDAMRRLLVERLGEQGADAFLTELRAAQTRYTRATRVEKARLTVERWGGRDDLSRTQQRQLAQAQLLVEHAAAYIADGGFVVEDADTEGAHNDD